MKHNSNNSNHIASHAMNEAMGYHSNNSNNKGFVSGAVTSFKGNMNQFGHDLGDFKIGLSGGYRHMRKSKKKMRKRVKKGKGNSKRSRRRTRRVRSRRRR